MHNYFDFVEVFFAAGESEGFDLSVDGGEDTVAGLFL